MKNKLLIFLPFTVVIIYIASLSSGSPSSIAMFLRTLSAFFIIFFLPGIYWIPLLNKRHEQPLSDLLLTAFPLSLLLTGIGTTIIKLLGWEIQTTNLVVLTLVLSLSGLFLSWQSWQSRRIINDLKPLILPLTLAFLVCFFIFWIFYDYFITEPSHYWPMDEGEGMRVGGNIVDWEFPGSDQSQIFNTTYEGKLIKGNGRQKKIVGEQAHIIINNPFAGKAPYQLHLLFQKASPSVLSLSLNGKKLTSFKLKKFIPLTCDTFIPLICHWMVEEKLMLEPGKNKLHFTFDAKGRPRSEDPLILENLSGLDKAEFSHYMNTHYQLIRVGPFYDALEALDFATNLKTKPFLYTRDLRFGVPGYTIANTPLEFFTDTLAMVLLPPDLSTIKKFYLAKLFFLALPVFCLLRLHNANADRRSYLLFLPVLFTQALILINFRHVEAADTLLTINFLLMQYFLLRGQNRLFVLSAFLTSITRNHGILLVIICLFVHSVIYRKWKPDIGLFLCFLLIMLIYGGLVLWIGYQTGVLDIWRADLYVENIHRFTGELQAWRSKFDFATFNGWLFLGSCGLPLFLLLKKDRLSWYMLLNVIPYYILICFSTYMKVYYIILFVSPLCIISLRNISQTRGKALILKVIPRNPLRIKMKVFLSLAATVLIVFCIGYLVLNPPTDPGFNCLFPRLTNVLMGKGILPPPKKLY